MPRRGPIADYEMEYQRVDLGYIAKSASLPDRAIATGEIHGGKLVDDTTPGDKLVDATLDLGVKGTDYTLTDVKVPTGELTFRRMRRVVGSDAAVPDTAAPLEVVHDFGVIPEHVSLSPGDAGVAGYAILVAKTITSIQIAGSASGVEIYYEIVQ